MNCDETRQGLSLYLYGELSLDERESIERHVERCEECRHALDRERAMHAALDRNVVDTPPALLAECRQQLSRKLRVEAGRRRAIAGWLPAFRRGWPAGFLKTAGALALIVLGFLAGREGVIPLRGEPVATQIRYIQTGPSGEVRIVLDETRQRVVSGRVEDETIRGLLLAAAQDASNPGLRVEAINALSARGESAEVRQALLEALTSDANPGVRLKAIEGLKPQASDPEVRSALSRVLLSDNDLGVRTEAINALVEHKSASLAGVLQEALHREQNNYVRLRCEEALREMNASLELF